MPTPPLAPVLASLPIHVYPAIEISWFSFAWDSAMIAICISLSINISLTWNLLDCNPLTFICRMLTLFMSFSSYIHLSIFFCFGILVLSLLVYILLFHRLLSLVCYSIQSLAPCLPHYRLSKVEKDSLAMSSSPIPIQCRVSLSSLVPYFFSYACHVSRWFKRFCCFGIHLRLNCILHRFLVAIIHSILTCG